MSSSRPNGWTSSSRTRWWMTIKVEVLTKTCLYENFVFSHDAPFPKSRKVIEDQPHALVLETIRGENGEEQSDLYLRGVATHLQVRKVNGCLMVGIYGPISFVPRLPSFVRLLVLFVLAYPQTDSYREETGYCPFEEQLDFTTFTTRELPVSRQEAEVRSPARRPLFLCSLFAQTACESISEAPYHETCVFDVAVTGDTGFVEATKAAMELISAMRSLTNEEFNRLTNTGDSAPAASLRPFWMA
ncbi:hypothetical protein QOT17_009090 [Balamuthia mandrillaris]